jgi:hypothetical protein
MRITNYIVHLGLPGLAALAALSVLSGCGGKGSDYQVEDVRFAIGWSSPVDLDLTVVSDEGASCTYLSCPIGTHSADDRGNDGTGSYAEGAWVNPTAKSGEPYRAMVRNFSSSSVTIAIVAAFGSNTSDLKVNKTVTVPGGTTVEVMSYRDHRFSSSRSPEPSAERDQAAVPEKAAALLRVN